jgi:transcriptional antiterminator RfaH
MQHVIDVVNFGDEPAVVPERLLQELRTWAGETVDLISTAPTLQPGDNVEIAEGPFQGLRAVILRETEASERVAVLLSIFDIEARVTLDRSQLIKAV